MPEVEQKNDSGLKRLQARVFSLTWLSYASYYFTRKNLSVVKSRLHDDMGVSVGALGGIDTLFLSMYALGQFLNGALGDRVGARKMIAFGMLASAGASLIFGLSSTTAIFLFVFGINGLFQSTGWPNNVKAMGSWFNKKKRGFIMGVWCTNYQVGGLVATALATYLLVNYGWRAAFQVPAVWVSTVAMLILLFLVEKPQDRGYAPLNEQDQKEREDQTERRAPFLEMIRLPILWILGCSYFGLKLIRYSLLFWLPFYMKNALNYSEGLAGYLSTAFEAGGIIGVILVGWIASRFFTRNSLRLVVVIILLLAASFVSLRLVSSFGPWAVGINLGLIGFMLFGPDALISGAVAQNVGKDRSTASAAGIINGFGSIGAATQGFLTAYVSQTYGWETLFLIFMGFALFSSAMILPLALKKEL